MFSYLDDDTALVISEGDVITAPGTRDRPHSLQTVVECRLEAVRVRMPDTHSA